MEAIGAKRSGEAQSTVVHRGTGETVNNLVINDDNLHGLGLCRFCFAEAGDTQRALLQGHLGDGKTVWSHSTMISYLQSHLDKIVTLDELGRWQTAIVAKLDSQELQAKLQGLAADGFPSTLDCCAPKMYGTPNSLQPPPPRKRKATCKCMNQ